MKKKVIDMKTKPIITEYKGRTLKTGFFDGLWHCWSSDGYLFNHSQGPEKVTEIMKQWIDTL